MGWGSQCENDRFNQSRGGICSFKIKNLLAVHSMGQFSISAARQIQNARIQYVTVERDGATRNSMVFQAAQNAALKNVPVSACMFRITPNCLPIDNSCGVPHSMIAPADNLGVTPFNMYWESRVIQASVQFFDMVVNDTGSDAWNSDRTVCVKQNLFTPDVNLVGPIPRGVKLITNAVATSVAEALVNNVIRAISNATGIQQTWLIALSDILIESGKAVMFLETTATDMELNKLEQNVRQNRFKPNGIVIEAVEIDGRAIVYPSVDPTISPKSSSKPNSASLHFAMVSVFCMLLVQLAVHLM